MELTNTTTAQPATPAAVVANPATPAKAPSKPRKAAAKAPKAKAAPKAAKAPQPALVAPRYIKANELPDLNTKLKFVAPNTKRGASRDRFAQYKVGMTLAQAIKAGVTKADLRWDFAHKLIRC